MLAISSWLLGKFTLVRDIQITDIPTGGWPECFVGFGILSIEEVQIVPMSCCGNWLGIGV